MEYIILTLVVVVLLIQIKTSKSIYTASKRMNALYDYFIVQEKFNDNMKALLKDIPDPTDGTGCPDDKELMK